MNKEVDIMRNILAIMKKQWKDTLKNKPVLIQFIIFPVMAVIMAKFVEVNLQVFQVCV